MAKTSTPANAAKMERYRGGSRPVEAAVALVKRPTEVGTLATSVAMHVSIKPPVSSNGSAV